MLILALVLAGWAWHRSGGLRSLLAFGLGAGFGGALAAFSALMALRQRRIEGTAFVQSVLLGSFVGIAGFGIGTVMLGLWWREALTPAATSAVGVYLAVKFFGAFSLMPRSRGVQGRAGTP
jgi:hypothetical protein